MKRLFIYIFTLFVLCSCSLNLEPKNSVTYTNYFKSEADLEALITTIMAKQRDIYATVDGSVKEIIGLECRDEDIVLNGDKIQNIAVGFRSLDPIFYTGRQYQSYFDWKVYYDAIYVADVLIDNEYRFKNITPQRAKFWIQQAHFLKAQMYFELARNWGDAPIPAGSESIVKKGKSPQIDVLNEAIRCAIIAKDMPSHEQLMGSNNKKLTLRQYASKGTVYTLLANIYAYMGGRYAKNEYWVEAEKYASEVIDGKAGAYSLEPTIADLCTNCLGKSRTSSETIFSIEMSSKDYNYANLTIIRNLYPMIRTTTFPIKGIATDVIQRRFERYIEARINRDDVLALYDEQEDERRTEFWYMLTQEEELLASQDPPVYPDVFYAYPNKLKNSDILYNTNNEEQERVYMGFDVNKVVWRLADLILLRAECRARLGLGTAIDDLNTVRMRAGLGAYNGSGDLRAEIYKERKRELFGEGHHFNDAVRNGYYSDISSAFGALSDSDIEKGALYYPVTEGAFKENDLMRQNTYWLWRQ